VVSDGYEESVLGYKESEEEVVSFVGQSEEGGSGSR